MEENVIRFYVVQNSEGKYFRRKGYGGYGPTWVDGLKRARTYNNLGGARAVVTWFANEYPDLPPPNVLVYESRLVETLDETDRIAKARQKKQVQLEKDRKRRAEAEIASLTRTRNEADRRLRELRGK